MHRDEKSLGQLLQHASDSKAGVRFIERHGGATYFSYCELQRRAAKVQGGLLANGLRRGDRLAIILPTGPAFLEVFFAAVRAGIVPVPLYPPVRLGRLQEYHARATAMLKACGARALVSDSRTLRILGPTIAAAELPLGYWNAAELYGAPCDSVLAESDALAFIQFSSGTTVDPKPVCLTHRQIIANTTAIRQAIVAAHPEEGFHHSCVSWLPLYHDMGLVGCVLTALAHRGDLTLISPEHFIARPSIWLQTLSEYRATISPAPNFAYGLCVEKITEAELAGVDLSHWRVAMNGAEPVTPHVLQRFVDRFGEVGLRRSAITPVYGLAEAALAVTFSPINRSFSWLAFDRDTLAEQGVARLARRDGFAQSLVSLGPPLPGYEIEIRDPRSRALPSGRVGELWVKGPSVMQGYLGQPEATAKALRDGWLHTGDTGFMWEGELYLWGRSKDIIIIRGRNFSPHDVERAADRVPGVRLGCSAAFGVLPEGADGEQLWLCVERQADTPSGPSDALALAVTREVLEMTGLRAERVLVLEPGTLPRTSSGKIRRGETRRLALDGRLTAPRQVTPWLLMKAMLSSRWALTRAKRHD